MKFLRHIPQVLMVVIGVIAAILSAVSDDTKVKIVAAFLTVATIVFQYLLSKPFSVLIHETDWHEVNGTFIHCVKAHEHGKGKTSHTHIYEVSSNGTRTEVMGDYAEPGNNGDVFIQLDSKPPKLLEARIS